MVNWIGMGDHPLTGRIAKVLTLAAFTLLGLIGVTGLSQDAPDAAPAGVVLIAQVEGAIGPGTVRYVTAAIEEANERGANALVLQLNTPGGLVTSMRAIIEEVLASNVPVIGYVAPQGGHAASAGTYILYATALAAMAPNTNIGAATPIQVGGLPSLPGQPETTPEPETTPSPEQADGDAPPAPDGQSAAPAPAEDAPGSDGPGREEPGPPPPSDASNAKAVNDAVAYIRSLAEYRGRNADWAEQAVRGAGAITPSEALDLNVIEVVAENLDDLLAQADGRTVIANGREVVLITAGVATEEVSPSLLTQVLAALANPNVAFIFMLVGVYGLIFELAQPGTIGPGVVGIISLVIGLYALNQLPLNYAGVALIVLGLAFMAIEAITPSFGIFGIGGIIALLFGGTILIDSDIPGLRIAWPVIGSAAAASAAMMIFVLGYVVRAARRPVVTGVEDMVGATVAIQDWAGDRGHGALHGERWHVRSDDVFAPGDTAFITRVDNLVLHVAAQPPKRRGKPKR